EYHACLGTPKKWTRVISKLPSKGMEGNSHYDLRAEGLAPTMELGTTFDIVFYDAFGPQAAPEMWAEPMLDAVFRHLAPSGVLVTFSVTGNLKRYLRARGIPFQTPKGFGPKRERMVAGPLPKLPTVA